MADLNNILIFVKVAQFESITRAARSLGMTISMVSRRLAGLESELGVSLLRRTTRRLTLTAQGREYLRQCQEPLSLLQEAEQVLTDTQKQPEGLLRITAPAFLSQQSFLDFIAGFLKDPARIRLDLVITSHVLDLTAENIDVAIRFGELDDSSVVARRLGKSVFYVAAAPEYLKARTQPAEPADLGSHDCVMFNGKNNERDWHLVSGRRKVRVHVSGRVSTRDINSVSTFVRAGYGIGLLPSTYCDEAIAKGKLIRLLPKWAPAPLPVFAVYPSRKFLPLRLSVFLRALADWKSPLWIRD
jgi:DNA-binding transcriptional LysR family regulator